jgi:hypothetical protein
LVTEVEGTQTRAIFRFAISIEFIISLVSEVENKQFYDRITVHLLVLFTRRTSILLPLKGRVPVDSKAHTPIPTEAALLQAKPMRNSMRNKLLQVFKSLEKHFFKGCKV